MKPQRTRAFDLYEEGRRYNQDLTPSYYTMVDTNTEFYGGNQWVHLPQTAAMRRLPKPCFNIIKRVTNVLVSQAASGGISVNLEPLSYYDGGSGDPSGDSTTEFAQAEVNNLLEKLKLEYRMREALFDGAQTGDYCAHFYWDASAMPYGGASGDYRGEIKMELVDGGNVMFGNPGTPEVQSQPYILLVGRDTVAALRQEYLRRHPGDEAGARLIQPDGDWGDQAAQGGKLELSGQESAKCLYLYLYERVMVLEPLVDAGGNPVLEPETDSGGRIRYETDGAGNLLLDPRGEPIPRLRQRQDWVSHIQVSKCTRSQTIFESVDTGLENYPIAWGNWEKQKNCYHGRALVTGVIPNQIFINSMFAMVMRHLQLEAFPKTVYNADLIGQWSNEIGRSIAVHGLQPGQAINQVAANLAPADMSGQIIGVVNQVVALTRECLGVTDLQLGNAKGENTSAIMVMQQSAQAPLENVRAGLYEWCEDVVRILLDMMGTYYGERPIVRSRTMEVITRDSASGVPIMSQYTGLLKTTSETRRVIEPYDFSRLKHIYLNVRVDVGAATAYSEISMMETLDNLRAAQLIDLMDYLERVPDKLIPRKQELLDKLRQEQSRAQGLTAGSALPDSRASAQALGLRQQLGKAAGKEGVEQTISQLPANLQAQFEKLPTRAKNALAGTLADQGG